MNKKDAQYLIQKTKKFRKCFVKQPGLFKVDEEKELLAFAIASKEKQLEMVMAGWPCSICKYNNCCIVFNSTEQEWLNWLWDRP